MDSKFLNKTENVKNHENILLKNKKILNVHNRHS